MKQEKRQKIEIFVDQPLLRRMRDQVEEIGITDYIVRPTLGGGSDKGKWHDDQVTGGAGSKINLTCFVTEDRVQPLMQLLEPLTGEYGLFIAVSPVEVFFSQPD